MSLPIRGVWCASLSPLDKSGALDARRFADHAKRLFAAGIDGIAPFGTTGEGPSFSVAERIAGLDALLAAGIAPTRVLPATGCAALPDAIGLTRHAVESGCAGALVLPPFFFTGVSSDGLYASYARLIEGVADPRLRLYLYHIPQMSGVAIDSDVLARLLAAYPGIVAGVKDSAGDLAHSRALVARFPQLSIFVGHEPHLPPMLAAGGAGTICGIANLYPRLMRRLHDSASGGAQGEEITRIQRFLDILKPYPVFAAFKALQVKLTGDPAWETLRPPLAPLDVTAKRAFLDAVDATDLIPRRDAALAA